MKYLSLAIAIVIAAPAAAQTAPVQHQDHAQHQPATGHAQHGQGHAPQGGQAPADHARHSEDCCADRDNNGRMDCCEQAEGAEARACCEEHGSEHAGH